MFFRKQLREKWIFERNKVECERERVLLEGAMMLMREGVRGVYALYYTHRGGIFNTTCDWLKNKPPETKEGPASGLCVALQSQLFSLGGRSSERPALQASKCSTLPRPFCTLLFVYSHPGGKDPTRGWLGLRLWCIESCSFGL